VSHRRVCTIVGCGASNARWGPDIARLAFRAGELAAQAGFIVLTGGRGGVMSEAARGARAAGGLTIGLLPTDKHADANEHLDIVLPTGIGYARNMLTALGGDVMVAVPGGQGTLQEMSYAVDYGRPVLSWDSWSIFPNVPVVPRDREDLVEGWIREQMKGLT
jgi:uncharacterized protein (TIGR00725 family)